MRRLKKYTKRQFEILSLANIGIEVRHYRGRLIQGGEFIQPRTWKQIRRLFRVDPFDSGAYQLTAAGARTARRAPDDSPEPDPAYQSPFEKCPECGQMRRRRSA